MFGEFSRGPRRSDREITFTQAKFCFRHNKLLRNLLSELPRDI